MERTTHKRVQALIWAAIIIAAAIASVAYGLSDSASLGVIGGLSGAALGSLQSDSQCSWGGLR